VWSNDDGDSSAKLSVSLSGLRGVAVDAAVAAGPHTWSGLLCDGTTASIAYVVAEDGSVSDVVATPDTAEVRTNGSKTEVRFSTHERVRIRVREDDGLIKISVDEKIRCDSDDPTTNVSTSIPADDDEHDGDHRDGDRHGGFGGFGDFGGGSGGHNKGDDRNPDVTITVVD
jgi:hypothetical protein